MNSKDEYNFLNFTGLEMHAPDFAQSHNLNKEELIGKILSFPSIMQSPTTCSGMIHKAFVCRCVSVLLQYLLQSCSRGGRGTAEDMRNATALAAASPTLLFND